MPRSKSLRCQSIIKLFRKFINENPELWTEELRSDIYNTWRTIVEHEDAFIDLAFEQGPAQGLAPEEVKTYIRFIADRRLTELGLQEVYQISKNPLLGWTRC
jgi:ribonucleoside-diphosphate reductase beta chain